MAVFERDEYLARIAKTKKRMDSAGIDVLLVTSPANINYLSGYDGQSFYTHQMLVLSHDASEPIWIGRGLDVSGAELTAFMDAKAIVGYPDKYVGDPENHPMKFIAEYATEKGWGRRTFGVEMDEYYFSARCYAELTKGLPNTKITDATALVNWVRLQKSAAELVYMEQAGRIAERAMSAAFDNMRPGVRQCEPIARLYAAQILGTDEYCGDFLCKAPNIGTGDRAHAVHLSWEDKVHRHGDTTWLETGGARYHYHAPLTRTIYMGEPPKKMKDLAKGIVEGLEAALEAARPGATCGEVAGAWQHVAGRHGITKSTRIGYPVGLAFPPNWGELTASIRAGDRTVLQSGMTFHCIPGIWSKEVTVVISESFQVTDKGGKAFANFPRRLFQAA